MAAAVGSNNIYPPIVTPFAPNFVISGTKGCKIYFSISTYNSIDSYKDIHITVTRQSDNVTALNKTKYPSQIIVAPIAAIMIDSTRTSNDKYYITLTNDDIQDGFQTGIVYKVQMRFSNHAMGGYESQKNGIDQYLSAHLSSFSEWSQVCLVQGINQPELQIKNGNGGILEVEQDNMLNHDTLEIVGTLITDDTDPLRQYELNLYNSNNQLIETSGLLFPVYQSSKDQLNYVFKRALQEAENYTLEVKYMTYGLYEETIKYPLFILLDSIEKLDVYLETIEDPENGRIGLHIATDLVMPFAGIITIRRTSSKSDFELWEDIHTVELRMEELDYTWYDYTVESGVWYKYCVQKRNSQGNRGIVTKLDTPVMIELDSLFLGAEGTQIKIKYNPQVSSFQTTVNDTKIDTIGAKYPYIKRNGATAYKQFPISGLITIMMDEDKIFADREDFYNKESLSLYNEYNDKNRIDKYNDVTYERDFREKVMAFLYKHNVKLYRSATEGNILVKLMNITFQPNQTLGRRIYSFQCTAYEVADCTIENIDYYGVQEVEIPRDNETPLTETAVYIGQWDSVIPANSEFIHSNPVAGKRSILEDYYSKDEKENYILSVDYLDYLKLEIYDEPYAIVDNGGEPQIYNDAIRTRGVEPAIYMGYIAYINGKTIIIPSDGIYELKGEDVKITSLYFAKDTDVEVQYNVQTSQTEDVTKMLSTTSFTTRIGQAFGSFLPGESLQEKLWKKYYVEHPGDYYQALVSINRIRVNGNPHTVVWVREEGEEYVQRHVLGPTESLEFYNDDIIIADAYFSGIHFDQATAYELDRNELPEGKCNKTDIVVNSLDKITDPKERWVYFLQSDNNASRLIQNTVNAAAAPELATIITVKGLPAYYIKKDNKDIAIIEERDLPELQTYLESINYEVYIVDSILFTEEQQIKIATDIDSTSAFEFVLNNEDNKTKMAAFKIILDQYGEQQITAALKRQIWKDIVYNVSDYYIYIDGQWFVFDGDKQDALCPVPASIDYVCETMKAYYRTSNK